MTVATKLHVLDCGSMSCDLTWLLLRPGRSIRSRADRDRPVEWYPCTTHAVLVETPEAYERLLLDCMNGDPTLFTRADEVEAAWAFIDPIEAAWRDDRPALSMYAAGSWGPAAADRLIQADGREWHRP